MKKALIITNHRKDRSPGQRFRFEQYLNFLQHNGYEINFSNLLSENDDKVFYEKGRYASKFWVIVKTFWKRCLLFFSIYKYDVIFIFREAYFTKTIFFETWYKKLSNAKFIFDFDDSIWIDTISEGNKKFAWLKDASKTSKLIALCNLIFAGNEYLADYARKYNKQVIIVPTTIDTQEYTLKNYNQAYSNKICIGWSGSFSTIQHFCFAIPALLILKEKYGANIFFKVIGDKNFEHQLLGIKGMAWNKEDEIKELQSFDIGIMPLPDDEWTKGKCGLKGLQYMALGIPTIMSSVGVNKDIIDDGVNGFLASNTEEWVEKISLLIESTPLRKKIGNAGRLTVEERYSTLANQSLYLKAFNDLIKHS